MPLAYEVLEFAGAMDLLWLAWQAVRPGARSAFEARALRAESPRKLFTLGLLTSVLNPKVAVFYLSVLPQFITADAGSVLVQSLVLGSTQVCIGAAVNLLVTLSAAQVALWFARNRLWLAVQRYAMGLVLGSSRVQAAGAAARRGLRSAVAARRTGSAARWTCRTLSPSAWPPWPAVAAAAPCAPARALRPGPWPARRTRNASARAGCPGWPAGP